MSLHCPATLVVASEREDPRALAARLGDDRLAAVYTASRPDAVATGRTLADALGAAHGTLAELELGLEPTARPSAESIVDRYADALQTVADLHRGETVLVLVPEPASASWSPLRVDLGDDGIRLTPWPPGDSAAPPPNAGPG